MGNSNTEYILSVNKATMRFPGVLALDEVDLHIRKGTVHALMGENGAGKSTLMKILIGINQPQEGTVVFKGKTLKINCPNDALMAGIAMIHQELSPIPEMTVAENIFLGREEMRGLFVRDKKIAEKTRKILSNLEIQNIEPHQKMKTLSTGQTQMVEIAKAVSYDASLVIMDEPTSAITEKEVAHLFKIIRCLKEKGVSIIYITHKMDEVFQIADDVTVLRDGKFIARKPAAQLNKETLIELMVGRSLENIFQKEQAEIGDVVLEIKNFTRKGEFNNISLSVRSGEILGLAGLMGAGRSELMMSLFGATKKETGEVYLRGRPVAINSPKDAIQHKMAFLTEDRKETGLYLCLTCLENIVMASVDDFKKGPLLDDRKIKSTCENEVEKFGIKTPSVNQRTELLSGGNQQKLLLARWMLTDPDVLILDEPTRGIDIGAKSEIYRLMVELAKEGKAIIMISSELPEIIGMSDRVIVMHEGELAGVLDSAEVSQEKILAFASGETNRN
ncbi:MAG: sugar ABC transporter ATP-binding protein [Lachnospiraceae bacterium]